MQRWYVDSCVFVAYYSARKEEKERRAIAARIFQDASEAVDLELVTSHWALTELAKVLIKTHNMDRERVGQIISNLIRKGRIEGAKVNFVDVSPRGDYSFSEMCSDLQDGIMSYSIGFQDVLHTIYYEK